MQKKRKEKLIVLPTSFTLNKKTEKNTIDLNYTFWSWMFSKKHIHDLFSAFSNSITISPGMKISMEYIDTNLSEIIRVSKKASDNYLNEPLIWYYSQIFIFILDIINRMNNGVNVSLGYGIIPRFGIEEYHKYYAYSNDNLLIMLKERLAGVSFSNNTDYIIPLKFDYDFFFVFVLSKYLKSKYTNIKIIVDLLNADEQNDYNAYIGNKELLKFIDDFIPMGAFSHRIDKHSKSVRNGKEGSSVSLRFLKSKCYWHQCAFCTINSKHQSDETFDQVDLIVMQRIDEIITIIKKNNIANISFSDEAIALPIILYFANELLQERIVCKWSIRARIDTSFTSQICKQLASAGLDTIGFGLESASARINKFINKRSEEYTMEQVREVLTNFDTACISTHIFFIIGFPSETKEETDLTLNFIHSLHDDLRRFSYTANIFSLMKGSLIEREPAKFGIVINDSNQAMKVRDIQYKDLNPGEKYSLSELYELQKKMRCKYFYKSADTDKKKEIAYKYWEYLSRSGLFFSIKRDRTNTRFYERKRDIEITDKVLNSHFLLIKPIILSGMKQYYSNITDEFFTPKNVIFEDTGRFLENYDSRYTLRKNIDRNHIGVTSGNDINQDCICFIKYLLDSCLLYEKK